jgi:hypothetical protein
MPNNDFEVNASRALVLRDCIPLFESWNTKSSFVWGIVDTIAFAVRPLSKKELSEINQYRISQGQKPHIESMVYRDASSLSGAPVVDRYDEAYSLGVACWKSGKAIRGIDLIDACKKAGSMILKESQANSPRIVDYEKAEAILNGINRSLWDAGYELNKKGTNWIQRKL